MNLPEAFLSRLREILPPSRIEESAASRLCYSADATNRPCLPDLVIFPESEEEIASILALATRHGVPVTPRGAGVGFSGGAVPVQGGVVLVTTRMNRILEVDSDNLTATVEPGAITHSIQEAARAVGLFYPPDPASIHSSTIGGNVAECAGGLSAVKYGVTKHYVLGARFVLPTGEICEYGGKTVKNVVGYDLLGLLVGSEGTLAVLTRLTLRLLPLPRYRETFLVSFEGVESAGRAVSAVIRGRIVPTALELMDRASIEAVERVQHYGFPENAGALLLVELDGSRTAVEEEGVDLVRILEEEGGHVLRRAQDGPERERIWDVRRSLSPAIALIRNTKINEDVSVPRAALPLLLRRVEAIGAERCVPIVCFGHAGDGNVHVNILVDRHDEDESARGHLAVEEVLRAAVDLGGAISGEHGIGLSKKAYIGYNLSSEIQSLSRRLKSAFDPAGILNPGKIFPDETP